MPESRPSAQGSAGPKPSILDISRVILKRKWIILLCLSVSIVLSVVFTRTRGTSYRTQASVEIQQVSYAAPGGTSFAWTDLSTEVHVVNSLPVVIQVARKLGRIPADLKHEEILQNDQYFPIVKSIQGMIRPRQRQRTSIVDIEVTSSNAKESRDIANLTAEAYKWYRGLNSREQSATAQEAARKQRMRLEAALEADERALGEFKISHRLLEVESSLKLHLSKLIELEEIQEDLENQKSALGETLQALQAPYLERQPSLPSLDIPNAPPNYEQLRQNFIRVLSEKQEKTSELTPQHPVILELDSRLKSLRLDLIRTIEQLELQILRRENDIAMQKNRIEAAKTSYLEDEIQLVRLQRKVEHDQEMLDEMQKAWQTAEFESRNRDDFVRVIEYALLPAHPDKSQFGLAPVIPILLMGLIVGLGLAFLREAFDFSLENVSEIEALVKLPVFSVIPHFDLRESGNGRSSPSSDPAGSKIPPDTAMVAHYYPKHPTSEAFRILRMGMRRGRSDRQVFLVTSATPQEGKSFVTSNLAIAFAQSNYSTLLIEANTRRPTLHKIFPLRLDRGLTSITTDGVGYKEVVRSIYDLILDGLDPKSVQRFPGLENLKILPAGPAPVHPSETIEQLMNRHFLEEVKKDFEVVIIDCPPILPVADAAVIGPHVDGVVLVYRVGRTPRDMLLRAVDTMKGVGANLIGMVLNDIDYQGPYLYPRYLYRYQRKGYTPEADARPRPTLRGRKWPWRRAAPPSPTPPQTTGGVPPLNFLE
ncbi:MAG: polysaccharide biosynthesis tyrosine autokinase [Nitrospirae bacterium]|nr:polysaccharide biosynthesis tyrosine autokinase [Nitrospirota bacterium]